VLNNISINPFTGLPTHLFPDGTNVQRRTVDDDAVGVGDVLLRTKYHFLSSNGLNLASGLGLRLPTGDEDDFQGLDDFVVTPFLAASQEYGRFDFHLQVGVDINADDTERSRVRYGAGVNRTTYRTGRFSPRYHRQLEHHGPRHLRQCARHRRSGRDRQNYRQPRTAYGYR
jgi:outer membrane putative beta-barrel porin/alpha-amylase